MPNNTAIEHDTNPLPVEYHRTEVWNELREDQRHHIAQFAAGHYMNGDQMQHILTFEDLHAANSWIMWVLCDDPRPLVIGKAQRDIVIPLFKRHIVRLAR